MRSLVLATALFLWMCDPEPPPAEHGGVVFTVGSQPLELVAQTDGQLTAYPIADSTARGPTAVVVVHVPGVDGVVHDAPLVWDEPSATFKGVIPVAPSAGPIEVDAILPGAPPFHTSTPTLIVIAPSAPIIVGAPPQVVEVHGPTPRGHVEVVAPSRPTVVVEAPRPRVGVIIEPPPPVVFVPPSPPGVVFMGPEPRGRVVIEGRDRDVRVDEGGGGHWDHGRHGGEGPEWHGGGGGGHGGHGH